MSNSNGNRASLLSGLRTGGVRSASGPIMPHTAAPGGSFQIPRFSSGHQAPIYEDPTDMDYGQTIQYNPSSHYGVPMTAGFVDSRGPRFHQAQHNIQQQMMRQAQLAAMSSPMTPMDQAQAMQLQMMQAMALQQNLQAQIALQQQAALNIAHQQATKAPSNRIPASAGPMQTSFDLRSNAVSQLRNSRLSSLPSLDEKDHDHGPVPMTAALGGKFGSRSLPQGFPQNTPSYRSSGDVDPNAVPPTPSSTVVISGGVSLGSINNATQPPPVVNGGPSKSDSATTWRRASVVGPSALAPRGASPPKSVTPPHPSPPRVTISTPEETDRLSPKLSGTPPMNGAALQSAPTSKFRPQPLRISANNAQAGLPKVEVEGYVSDRSSSPPHSDVNAGSDASKKYEGVGIGRARAGSIANTTTTVRVSQPVRQPRGPPAAADDFGSKNFASRIRRSPPMAVAVEAF